MEKMVKLYRKSANRGLPDEIACGPHLQDHAGNRAALRPAAEATLAVLERIYFLIPTTELVAALRNSHQTRWRQGEARRTSRRETRPSRPSDSRRSLVGAHYCPGRPIQSKNKVLPSRGGHEGHCQGDRASSSRPEERTTRPRNRFDRLCTRARIRVSVGAATRYVWCYSSLRCAARAAQALSIEIARPS